MRKFVKPLDDDRRSRPRWPGSRSAAGVTGAAQSSPTPRPGSTARLRHELACGSHTLFVGEVVACGGDPADGLEVLRMEDTRMSYGG